MREMEKFLVFLAQGLGSGLAKKAPGTWGSLVAVIIAWFITPSLLTIIIAAAVGVYICTVAAKALNDDDPSCVVFDEWVGMWIALWALPHHLIWYVLAFGLFRLFDITKPWLIDKVQHYPDGWGIMLDDMLAGLVSRIILAVLVWIF